ncbi:Enolase, N-terminal [Dillenia turbinata]|uniref:Enolase, N-terminal n=1 Tax=Dillenia turbinata TaxID=194707 RepID=A0AAN8VPC6_9MAGN
MATSTKLNRIPSGNAAQEQITIFTKKDIEGRKMLSHHVRGPEKVKSMETNKWLSEISSTNDFARKCDMKSEDASGRSHRRSARSVSSKEFAPLPFSCFMLFYPKENYYKEDEQYEAVELRDGGKGVYLGNSVTRVVRNINDKISKALIGMDPTLQSQIDQAMMNLDKIEKKVPLYKPIADLARKINRIIPIPTLTVISGGRHAGNSLAIQQVAIRFCGSKIANLTCLMNDSSMVELDPSFSRGPEKVKSMETNKGLSEISSTNDFARKCDMKSEDASGRSHRRSARSVSSKEVGLVGFVAFNADYHGPQHHPPKNN